MVCGELEPKLLNINSFDLGKLPVIGYSVGDPGARVVIRWETHPGKLLCLFSTVLRMFSYISTTFRREKYSAPGKRDSGWKHWAAIATVKRGMCAREESYARCSNLSPRAGHRDNPTVACEVSLNSGVWRYNGMLGRSEEGLVFRQTFSRFGSYI